MNPFYGVKTISRNGSKDNIDRNLGVDAVFVVRGAVA